MKNSLLIFVSISLMANQSIAIDNKPLANEGKNGLYARSIEQVLRLGPEDVDLATAVLLISEQWSDMVNGKRYITELDDMALEIRDRVEAKKIPMNYKAIPVINEYLFDELGFKSLGEADNPNDLFLHSVLDNKHGYCLSLSVLYLSIGERLGLPLYGVVVPGHFFVRYDDGHVRFNIETTSKGGTADDKHYKEKFKVPENDNVYLSSLNPIQTLGCFFNNLGNSYNDVGNIDQALLALKRAVEINPTLTESRTNLGNIYLKKDMVDNAIREYKTALEINSNDSKTHNNLGNAYLRKNWLSEAIQQYSQSIKIEPNFVDAYKNLASAYFHKEMYNEAQTTLTQAMKLDSKNADIYTIMGDVFSKTGDLEKAVENYKKAIKLKPKNAQAYYGLAICYDQLKEDAKEIQAYRQALDIEPNMTAALINLGNIYFKRKEYKIAASYYTTAAGIKPDDVTVHYNLGATYSNSSEFAKAAEEYLKAIEIDANFADAHNGLAFAYYKLNNFELALKYMKSAQQLGVKVPDDLADAIKAKTKRSQDNP